MSDLKDRLQAVDNTWSQTILHHWNTLPPTLLQVIFKAVKECENKSPFDILALERKMNSKWRQTGDYKVWLRGKSDWVDDSVDFYFDSLDLPESSEEPVIYEAPQEVLEDEAPAICPVTGQVASTSAVCPVSGQASAATGPACPFGYSATQDTCPV